MFPWISTLEMHARKIWKDWNFFFQNLTFYSNILIQVLSWESKLISICALLKIKTIMTYLSTKIQALDDDATFCYTFSYNCYNTSTWSQIWNLSQKPLWDNVVAVSLTNACQKLKLNTKAIKYSWAHLHKIIQERYKSHENITVFGNLCVYLYSYELISAFVIN